MSPKQPRHSDGSYASPSFEALYAEIKRIDQLRTSDQLANAVALTAAEKAVVAALAASDKAVAKAEDNQQRVNEGQNEFRAQLKDQAATLMPRAEAELIFKELRERISTLQSRLDVGPPSLLQLQKDSDANKGRSAGTGDTWKLVAVLVGAIVAAASLIVGALALFQH